MFKIRFCLILFLFLCIRAVVFSEEYSAVMENYQGYYIYKFKVRPNEMLIFELRFQEHLILQRVFIENNDLLEGDRTVLDHVSGSDNGIIIFTEGNKEFNYLDPFSKQNRENCFVIYNPSAKDNSEILKINYKEERFYSSEILNLRNSFFAKDVEEVIDIYNSYFSLEALKEFTGRFLFNECEIINISNMENPIKIIINDEIIIDIGEWRTYGYPFLFYMHISANRTSERMPFTSTVIMRDGRLNIGSMYADGYNYGYHFAYYYTDKDTIIYEWQWSGDNDNNEYAFIEYRIIFKRENASE